MKKIIALILIIVTIIIGFIYFQKWNNYESLQKLSHILPGKNSNQLIVQNITINNQKLDKLSTLKDEEMITLRGESKPNSTLFISTNDPNFTSRIIKTNSSGHWICHFPSDTFRPGNTIIYAQIFYNNNYSEKIQIAKIIIGDIPRSKSLKPMVNLYSIVTLIVMAIFAWGAWNRHKAFSPW